MAPRILPILLIVMSLRAAESASSDPLWDGHESIAAYAQRIHREPTKMLDLGNGVQLEMVLIPAGRFIMGTSAPEKPGISVFSAYVIIGIGAAFVLALLAKLLLRRRKERRFSFSLKWLMALCVACGMLVWGGARRHLALVQNREYEAALENYEDAQYEEKPGHPVTITKAFYMGKYPVTQAQYEVVMGHNPSKFKGPQNPVEFVSWDDATEFCTRINDPLRAQPLEVHLPTEAQWEYACRAGTKTRFYSGDRDADLNSVAWCQINSTLKTYPVGRKAPNAFGLYDMLGNVAQYCRDLYREDYANLSQTDPVNTEKGIGHVVRGSSTDSSADFCRAAIRSSFNSPTYRSGETGFRITMNAE